MRYQPCLTQGVGRRCQGRAGVHQVVDQLNGAAWNKPLACKKRMVRGRVAAVGKEVPLGCCAQEHSGQRAVVGHDCGEGCAASIDRGNGVGLLHCGGEGLDEDPQLNGSTEDTLEVGDADAWVALRVQCLDVTVAAPQDIGRD